MDGWWVADLWAHNRVALVAWITWVVGSICLHELAHGWAAIRLGDRTPIETGHMTANPMVHMGGMSLIVFLLIGIAWGAMPVNPNRLRGRHADAYVAAAGPAMNLLLAIVAVLLAVVCVVLEARTNLGAPAENAYIFFRVGAALNLLLMMFNLLPIPPLDGSRIVASYRPSFREFYSTGQGQAVGLILFAAVFFYGAGKIFDLAFGGADSAIDFLSGLLV